MIEQPSIREKIAGLPWKFILPLINSFILIPNVMIFMFLIYMGEENFFSYDFFTDGIFGMKIFFLLTIISLIILSIMAYAPLFFIAYKKKKNECRWWWIIPCILISALTILLLFAKTLASGDHLYLFFLIILSGAISILFLSYFFDTKKQVIMSLTAYAFIFHIIISFPEHTAKIASTGLKKFGMGGNIDISIITTKANLEDSETPYLEGKLKLVTPKFIYFIPKNDLISHF